MNFIFSSFGTNGTDYTLVLSPNSEYPLIAKAEDDYDSLTVSTMLYDYDKKEIPITAANFDWRGPSGYSATEELQNNELIGCIVQKTESDTIYAGILTCAVSNVKIDSLAEPVTLTSCLPIPYGLNKNLYIEGPTSVIYDSFGTNPSYHKVPYKLYSKNSAVTLPEELTWYI
jgi:hypothetical protein